MPKIQNGITVIVLFFQQVMVPRNAFAFSGYDIPMEQIKQFRQWGSTIRSPERSIQHGVKLQLVFGTRFW